MSAEPALATHPLEHHDDPLNALLQRSLLQRLKGERERGEAQRTRAHALRTIALLRNNLKTVSDDHLFKGVPLDGSEIDTADPVGMHAYTATGALPAGVTQVSRRGSAGKVHQITWHWAGQAAGTAKPSTMFPSWMPPDHIRTLVQLTYPGACATPLATLAGLPVGTPQGTVNAALHSDAAKRYITRNTAITLQQLGSGAAKSYYPNDP